MPRKCPFCSGPLVRESYYCPNCKRSIAKRRLASPPPGVPKWISDELICDLVLAGRLSVSAILIDPADETKQVSIKKCPGLSKQLPLRIAGEIWAGFLECDLLKVERLLPIYRESEPTHEDARIHFAWGWINQERNDALLSVEAYDQAAKLLTHIVGDPPRKPLVHPPTSEEVDLTDEETTTDESSTAGPDSPTASDSPVPPGFLLWTVLQNNLALILLREGELDAALGRLLRAAGLGVPHPAIDYNVLRFVSALGKTMPGQARRSWFPFRGLNDAVETCWRRLQSGNGATYEEDFGDLAHYVAVLEWTADLPEKMEKLRGAAGGLQQLSDAAALMETGDHEAGWNILQPLLTQEGTELERRAQELLDNHRTAFLDDLSSQATNASLQGDLETLTDLRDRLKGESWLGSEGGEELKQLIVKINWVQFDRGKAIDDLEEVRQLYRQITDTDVHELAMRELARRERNQVENEIADALSEADFSRAARLGENLRRSAQGERACREADSRIRVIHDGHARKVIAEIETFLADTPSPPPSKIQSKERRLGQALQLRPLSDSVRCDLARQLADVRLLGWRDRLVTVESALSGNDPDEIGKALDILLKIQKEIRDHPTLKELQQAGMAQLEIALSDRIRRDKDAQRAEAMKQAQKAWEALIAKPPKLDDAKRHVRSALQLDSDCGLAGTVGGFVERQEAQQRQQEESARKSQQLFVELQQMFHISPGEDDSALHGVDTAAEEASAYGTEAPQTVEKLQEYEQRLQQFLRNDPDHAVARSYLLQVRIELCDLLLKDVKDTLSSATQTRDVDKAQSNLDLVNAWMIAIEIPESAGNDLIETHVQNAVEQARCQTLTTSFRNWFEAVIDSRNDESLVEAEWWETLADRSKTAAHQIRDAGGPDSNCLVPQILRDDKSVTSTDNPPAQCARVLLALIVEPLYKPGATELEGLLAKNARQILTNVTLQDRAVKWLGEARAALAADGVDDSERADWQPLLDRIEERTKRISPARKADRQTFNPKEVPSGSDKAGVDEATSRPGSRKKSWWQFWRS